jgi:hypothetical protein
MKTPVDGWDIVLLSKLRLYYQIGTEYTQDKKEDTALLYSIISNITETTLILSQ